MFAADAIRAMTDVDLAVSFRGKYSSSSQVRKVIGEYAGSSSVRALTERIAIDYKMPELKILRARRGDLVLLKRPRDYSLGIVDLNGKEIVVAFDKGLSRLPMTDAFRTWGVG